jgi:hypothetical protein
MADKDIVGGIFGMTPEMYAMNRDIMGQQKAAALAAQPGTLMNPSLAPFYAQAAQQGQLMGKIAGGLLGVEDPELAKVRDVQQMRTQFDVSTPTGLRSFAQALGQRGYTDLAIQATARAADIDKDIATAEDKREAKIKQVGLSDDGRQVYQSGTEQFILGPQGKIPYYGKLESKSSKTEVNIGGLDKVFTEAFNKAEGKDQAEAWSKAGVAYGEAAKLGKNLREIESLVGDSFVGPYGSLQAGVSRVFGGSQKLSNTEIVDALTKQLVVPLVKQFPGSLAVKELDTLMKTTPNIAQKEETIRRLLARIQEEVKANELAYEAGERYRAQKGTIVGFNPNIANNRAMRFVELEKKLNKSKDKKLSDAEKREAESIAVELGLK